MDEWATKIKADPEKYVIHGIDALQGNSKKPELKCQAPCHTCLDAKPQWCTSCWGPTILDKANGNRKVPNAKTFLMQNPKATDPALIATCKDRCDDAYTTNGAKVTPSIIVKKKKVL